MGIYTPRIILGIGDTNALGAFSALKEFIIQLKIQNINM